MILLKKKNEAQEIRDYRPISLMHSFGKLIAKCLARRLALVLNDLVHPCQSAFIQGRSIHDNFHAVHLTCKTLPPPQDRYCESLRLRLLAFPFGGPTMARLQSAVEELDVYPSWIGKHQSPPQLQTGQPHLPCQRLAAR